VIDAAGAGGVERVLFMSSDEAVNPTSVMGASKRLSTRGPASPQRTGAEAMRAAQMVAPRCGTAVDRPNGLRSIRGYGLSG
jgi:FlaA1/EpsC-like NDP-sugar epimerase